MNFCLGEAQARIEGIASMTKRNGEELILHGDTKSDGSHKTYKKYGKQDIISDSAITPLLQRYMRLRNGILKEAKKANGPDSSFWITSSGQVA